MFRTDRRQSGFTLIELLVVVAIIGILAAIAIPEFAAYKTRSYNSRAESDFRNAITAEEAYYVVNEAYASCSFNSSPCAGVLPGFVQSTGVLTTLLDAAGMAVVPAPGGAFAGASCHIAGDRMFDFATTALSGVTLDPGYVNSHEISNCLSKISSLG